MFSEGQNPLRKGGYEGVLDASPRTWRPELGMRFSMPL